MAAKEPCSEQRLGWIKRSREAEISGEDGSQADGNKEASRKRSWGQRSDSTGAGKVGFPGNVRTLKQKVHDTLRKLNVKHILSELLNVKDKERIPQILKQNSKSYLSKRKYYPISEFSTTLSSTRQ